MKILYRAGKESRNVRYKSCHCELSLYSETRMGLYSLINEDTEHRNKGYAKKVLTICKRIADKLNITIELTANPWDDRPLSREQLDQFYYRQGFVKSNNQYSRFCTKMIYYPRGTSHG